MICIECTLVSPPLGLCIFTACQQQRTRCDLYLFKKNDDSQNGDDNKNKKVRAITCSAEDVLRLVASIIGRGSGDDHILCNVLVIKVEITNFLYLQKSSKDGALKRALLSLLCFPFLFFV